jgi:hypothetical protein
VATCRASGLRASYYPLDTPCHTGLFGSSGDKDLDVGLHDASVITSEGKDLFRRYSRISKLPSRITLSEGGDELCFQEASFLDKTGKTFLSFCYFALLLYFYGGSRSPS